MLTASSLLRNTAPPENALSVTGPWPPTSMLALSLPASVALPNGVSILMLALLCGPTESLMRP